MISININTKELKDVTKRNVSVLQTRSNILNSMKIIPGAHFVKKRKLTK